MFNLLEISPDLRTAIATERLTIATWSLVVVGAATLLAASVAAIAGVRAYLLESTPSVSFTGREDGFPASSLERPYVVTRDHDLSGPGSAKMPGRKAPVVLKPFFGDARAVDKNRQIAIEARNLGRTPVVEAQVTIRFNVREITGYDEGSPITAQYSYEGIARIKAIPANESVVLPLINEIGSLTIEVIDVTGIQPVKAGRKPRSRRLPFVSSTLFVPPP